jgi:hypothetical protein
MFTGAWQDGDIVYYNNVAANSLHGFRLWGEDTHGHVNTRLVNNIIINNEGYGISLGTGGGDYGNLTLDHNLYYRNGWRPEADGGIRQAGALEIVNWSAPNEYYPTLADIQAHTPWEAHGVEGDPLFRDYDPADHELHDGSWPDFHLTAASTNAIDRGTATLPASLVALLDAFDVTDFQRGDAYDIGRYEAGFAVLADPSVRFVDPGGETHYALRLHPADLSYTVTLTVTSPSPLLVTSLSSPLLAADAVVTLTVTDHHTDSVIVPAQEYVLPITATGGGFTQISSVRLLVGGERVYLPTILQDDSGARLTEPGSLWASFRFGGQRVCSVQRAIGPPPS